MRALVPCFLKLNRSVAGDQFSSHDRAGAQPTAIGAGLRLIGGSSLLGGGFLAEQPRHLLTGLVGALFNGREIEIGEVALGLPELAWDQGEKLLEVRVLRSIPI